MSSLVETTNTPNNGQYQAPAPKVAVANVPMPIVQSVIPMPVQNQAPTTFKEAKTKMHIRFDVRLKDHMTTNKVIENVSNPENIFKPVSPANVHALPLPGHKTDSKFDLSKVVITSQDITGGFNKLPFDVKFDWEGQGEMCTQVDMKGQLFAFSMHSGESQKGYRVNVYDARNSVNDPILSKYGHLSSKDIKESIRDVGTSSCIVPGDSEVIRFIVANEEKFGKGIITKIPKDRVSVVEGKTYYTLPRQLVYEAVSELQNGVLSKFNFVDLTKFKVCMSRMDGRDFGDLTGTDFEHLDEKDKSDILNRTYSCAFDLEMTWGSPNAEPRTGSIANIGQKVPISAPRQ